MTDPSATTASNTAGAQADSSAGAGSEQRPEVLNNAELTAANQIESPAKIIRIGAMVKQLLEEVRNMSLDEAARDHLRDVYLTSIEELKSALSPDLGEELDRMTSPFDRDSLPTEAEIRVAQAQLVGWLEGLFHGIQATLVAQQMSMRQQLEGVRHQLSEPGAPSGTGYL